MDLIDKIKEILLKVDELKSPIIDLKFDKNGNVKGFITSDSFSNMDDEKSQDLIWDTLRKHLENEELVKVLAIFNETSFERENRLHGSFNNKIKQSNIWFHNTKDLKRYWAFIDVTVFKTESLTFFLIVNASRNLVKRLIIKYPEEVIQFMNLKQQEIYQELFSNSFNNTVAEIKMDLMNLHDKLDRKGVNWKDNIYSYVYDNFELHPASTKDLLFSEKEIELIEKGFKGIDGYTVNDLVKEAIEKSKIINKLKKGIE